jgi:hypothetical protein
MAITLVGVAEGAAGNGGNVTIDLTPIGLAENDLVCVYGGMGGTLQDPGVSTSGYTEDTTKNNTGIMSSSFSYKKMTSSPDTSVTCLGSGIGTSGTAYIVMAFRGVDTSTPLDAPTAVTASSNSNPNSSAIGTFTDGAAVISFVNANTDDTTVTKPTGYDGQVDVSQTESNDITVAGAWKAVALAGSENPPSWTDFTTSAVSWTAMTVALRPSASGTFGDGELSSSGFGTASFVGVYEAAGPLSATATVTASFIAAPFVTAALTATGTGTASLGGVSLATSGAFSLTGNGTASFVGGLAGSGNIGATGTWTVGFEGASILNVRLSLGGSADVMFVAANPTNFISHIKEVIESKGATSVSIG